MKKSIFSIVLFCLSALTGTAQTWDFTTPFSATDLANLQADTKNWSDANGDQTRFSNLTDMSGELKANGQVIAWTVGLQFGTMPKDKIRLDPGTRISLNGKNLSITIPDLKKGQTVTVVCKTANPDEARGLTVTNLTPTSGSFNGTSVEEQTNVGTVDAAGSVTLTTTAGMSIMSIKVEGEGEDDGGGGEGDDPTPQPTGFSTTMNLMQNQMHLTLQDGDIKYYNTTDVKSVDIDNDNVTVVPFSSNISSDEYSGNVTKIGFAKKSESGGEGEYENEEGKVVITASKGWLESAYVTWTPFSNGSQDADSYHVYVKGGQYTDYTQIDQPLVRNYGSYGRADVVGLQSGTYTLKVVPVFGEEELSTAANEASAINVKNYKREGYAFKNNYSPGAYNSDGTLKSGAVVIYVTSKNAKTVTAKLRTGTYTGLQEILSAYESPADNTPLAIRFIGTINAEDVDRFDSKEEGLQMKGKRADHEVNVTFEGIGEDAAIRGFGILIRNCKGVEMRNFGSILCMDDGISLDTDNSNIWLHHLDMFYGKNQGGDKTKGDGSIDVKADSKYVTVSYCHFCDTGNSNKFGKKSDSGPN
jgi:pectate lyase